jgi:peptidylprolyl isomerase
MQQVKNGDTIQVHYHGTLASGETFDSSNGRAPLEFEVGSGMVIPGFDSGVLGMTVGEKKTVQIPFMEAYGPKQPEMIVEFPKTQFPPDLNPEVGMALTMNNGQGQQFQVMVVEVKEEVVVLDANHSLAGQDLTFDLELVSIDSPSKIIKP